RKTRRRVAHRTSQRRTARRPRRLPRAAAGRRRDLTRTEDRTRSVHAWRAGLLASAFIAVATVLLVLAGENVFRWNGGAGWTLQPAGPPFVVEVASVARQGPA